MSAVFGSLVLGLALAIYKKPAILIGIGLVAAVFCFLAVPFLPIPIRSATYGPVMASATAAITGAISLTLVASLWMGKLKKSMLARIGIGALYAMLASTLFILATTYATDKAICLDLGYRQPLPDFLGIGGMVWMGGAVIFFPLGYLVGMKVQSWLTPRLVNRPSLSHATPIVAAILCCGLGTLAFAAGL